MKATLVLVAFFVGFHVMIGLAVGDHSTPFKITTKRKDDTVTVATEKDRTIISVTSPTGISQAGIERTADKWPDMLVLRLHLKGLESCRIASGDNTLDLAVSSHSKGLRVRQWRDGKEDTLLTEKSIHWVEIRAFAADGKPLHEIPLQGGYFELRLPKAFFTGNPRAITVNWIDFFRN